MKTIRALPNLSISCLLILLGACRDKKVEKPVDASSSYPPPAEAKTPLTSKEMEKHTAPFSATKEQLAKSAQAMEQNIQKQREALEKARDFLFSVPLSDAAAKERQDAWDLMEPHPWGLDGDQYKYACDLLDRYANAPPLEKLAFWQLCNIRLVYESLNGIVRGIGGSGAALEILEEKMKATLYSSLGQKPENMTYAEAISEGNMLLKQAIKNSKNNKN